MSCNKIITTEDVKIILGIEGTDSDALINIWIDTATDMLKDILEVSDLAVHTVTDEEVKIYDPRHIIVQDFPVDTTQTITIKDSQKNELTGYTFELTSDRARRTLRVLDANGTPTSIGYCSGCENYYDRIFISYTAGYTDETIPESLKNAVAFMVGGGIADQNKVGDVVEYTIGGKTVKFGGATKSEAVMNGQTAMATFKYWIPKYMKVDIQAV